MSPHNRGEPGHDGALVLFMLGIGLLLSPMLWLWSAPGRPWWSLYLVWALLIVAIALLNRRHKRN